MTTPSKMTTPLKMTARPESFLRWVGSKRQLLPELLKYIPDDFTAYHEPFLGGGSLFFELSAQGKLRERLCILSDINVELVNTYVCMRDLVDAVIDDLGIMAGIGHRDGPPGMYNLVREAFNSHRAQGAVSNIQGAARFIYLNKTCFNGLYRVNKKGEFNVPMGTPKALVPKNRFVSVTMR